MSIPFATEPALDYLASCDVDLLDVGVIGFDTQGLVRVYNRFESAAAGLSPERVLGQHIFESVAPCMNNFLVAQCFEDAARDAQALDIGLDYVLTLRMRPTAVRLRLLSSPQSPLRYILVER